MSVDVKKTTTDCENIDVAELLFIIGYSIFLITILLGSNIEIVQAQEQGADYIDKIFKLLRYGSYALFIASLAYRIVERRILFVLMLATLFLMVELTHSSNNTMLLYVFLFIGAIGMDARRIIMTSCICKGIMLFVTVGLSQIGVIQDYIFVDGGRNRHGLGFSWTTTGHILFLHWLLEYIFMRRGKVTIFEYAIMELLNIWFYWMTDASMTFYVITGFIAYFAVARIENQSFAFTRKISRCVLVAPALCALIAIMAQYLYDETNPTWKTVDAFTHGRLNLGHNGIVNYGITWLGQAIHWQGFSVREMKTEYNYIDCSYLQIAIEYGLIFLILVLVIYTVILYRANKNRDYYLLSAICFLLVFAMTEPRLINLMYTSFPLLVLAEMREVDPKELESERESIFIFNTYNLLKRNNDA